MLNVKVAFKEEDIRLWRRVPANRAALAKQLKSPNSTKGSTEVPVFADLCKFINDAIADSLNVSPDSVDPSYYRLQYCDSDGDWLTIRDEQGWIDSLLTAVDEGNKSLKVHVCASQTSAQLGSSQSTSEHTSTVDVSTVLSEGPKSERARMISRSVSDPRSTNDSNKTPGKPRITSGSPSSMTAGIVFTPSPPMSGVSETMTPAAMKSKRGLDLPSEVMAQSSFSSLPMTPPCAGQQGSLKHGWEDRSKKRTETRVAGESATPELLIEKHLGVACSVCSQEPITGVRWKCAFCQSLELCGQCERVIHQLKDDEQVTQYLQRHLKSTMSDAGRCHLKSHPLIRMTVPLLSSTSQVFDKEQRDFDMAIRKGHTSALGSSVNFTRLWQLKGVKELDYAWQALVFGLLQIKQQGIQQAQLQQQQQQQQQQQHPPPPYQPYSLFDGFPAMPTLGAGTATLTSSVPSVGQPEGTGLEGFDIGGGQVGLFPGVYQDSLGLLASTNSMSSLPGLTSTLGSFPTPGLFGGASFVSPALSSVSSAASFGLAQPVAQPQPKPELKVSDKLPKHTPLEPKADPPRPSAVKIEAKTQTLPQPPTPTVSRPQPTALGESQRRTDGRYGYSPPRGGRSDFYHPRPMHGPHHSRDGFGSGMPRSVRNSGPGWRRSGDPTLRGAPPMSNRTRKRKKRPEMAAGMTGPSSTAAGPAKMTAEFISNLTVPDRSEQKMGSQLRKVWTLRNNGVSDWGPAIKLGFLKGNRELCLKDEYSVPNAHSGEVVEVVADVSVPHKEGRFCAYFRLKRPTGEWFGPRLWVDIFAVP